MSVAKRYLGDGVYARTDKSTTRIVLTTENGEAVMNVIVLEWETYNALTRYAERLWEQRPGEGGHR